MQQYSNDKAKNDFARAPTGGLPRSNADVLAKALLDIKLMLDIERVLAEELHFEMPQKRRPVHDQILTIIHDAGAVSAAEGIQTGFRGLRVVK